MEQLILKLNGRTKHERLLALKALISEEKKRGITVNFRKNDANNHIHTTYSFSPYSPTKAAYCAYKSGLETMGIMDHDSLSGAEEFIEACQILNVGSTVGVETRVHFKRGFGRINNPDQTDHMYIAAHGIPHQNIEKLNNYFAFYREKRNDRNRLMTKKINDYLEKFDISLDFDKDVYSISMACEGGSITERHLLYALAGKLLQKFGIGLQLINFLVEKLNLSINDRIKTYLSDENNSFIQYDLLGVLKSDTSMFYIPATDESPEAEDYIKFVQSLGGVVAYAYLGDIGDSVTGDKKSQKFEDAYLPDLLKELSNIGVNAVAYMPTRNTKEQLLRLRELCKEFNLFEISGEDINSPRQIFECAKLKEAQFANLIDSAWALIGHEFKSTADQNLGMFSAKTIAEMPNLIDRVDYFAKAGRESLEKKILIHI